MRTFTFDTNCLIDLADDRPAASFVRELIGAHRREMASVAFVAVSASERQKGDFYLPTYQHFLDRLKELDVDDIPQIKGIAYLDISYWDSSVFADEVGVQREQVIHRILFPNIPFNSPNGIDSNGQSDGDVSHKARKKWRNAWCDRQMIWAHDYAKRDVFVTSDTNFENLEKHPEFSSIKTATPKEAVELL